MIVCLPEGRSGAHLHSRRVKSINCRHISGTSLITQGMFVPRLFSRQLNLLKELDIEVDSFGGIDLDQHTFVCGRCS
jgi:hypothetical protein